MIYINSIFEYKAALYFDLSYYYKLSELTELEAGKPIVTILNGNKVIIKGGGEKVLIYYVDSSQLEAFIFPTEDTDVALRHYFFTRLDDANLEMSYSETGFKNGKYFINANAVEIEQNGFVDDPEYDGEDAKLEIDPRNLLGMDSYDVCAYYSGNPMIRSVGVIGDKGYEDNEPLSLQNMLFEETRLGTSFSKTKRKLG